MTRLPPKPIRYPDNSPIAAPAPAKTAIKNGSKASWLPRMKMTTDEGIGIKIEVAPRRLMKKIPK